MIDKNNIPAHVAIIMDGNGRWAKEKGLPRTFGHRQGVERVKEITDLASELGIKVVTFFAFSSENWKRPRKEVGILMRYLGNFLDREVSILHKKNVRIMFIGHDDPIPKLIQKKIKEATLKTGGNTGLTVVIALNYGARQEIVDAAKKALSSIMRGEFSIDDLNTEVFSRYFYTAGLPDPDLLIRTSGEMRISNFLLWQLSYAELYFPKKYWPDFRRDDFIEAIGEYQKRERRFGHINAKEKNN